MIHCKKTLLIFWEILLCLIVIKDTLLCITENAVFQTYLGRALNGAALLFMIAFVYFHQRIRISRAKNKITASIFCYFILLISISILIHHVLSDVMTPYYLILLLGFLLWDMDQQQYYQFLRDFRYFLSAYIVISLILLPFGYGRWEESFQSFIPSVNFRLMGITTQPNGLGFMISIYIGLFFRKNKLISGLAIIALLLTQSKTAIMGLAAWYVVLGILKIKECRQWSRILSITVFLMINAGIILLLVTDMVSDSGFTGRVGLWRYGFERWSSSLPSMLLGAGENVLTTYSRFYAKQAHNQFLNNLFGAGIIGFFAALLLCAYICKWIILDFKNQRKVSAFLGVVILIRCLMECPFYGLSIGNFGMIILVWLTLQVYDLNQFAKKGRIASHENCAAGPSYSQ